MYNDKEEVQAKTNNVQIDHAPNLIQKLCKFKRNEREKRNEQKISNNSGCK